MFVLHNDVASFRFGIDFILVDERATLDGVEYLWGFVNSYNGYVELRADDFISTDYLAGYLGHAILTAKIIMDFHDSK